MEKGKRKSRTDLISPDEMSELTKLVETKVSEIVGRHTGVTLLIFDFGGGGNMQYASNAQRTDMIAALREFLQYQAASGKVMN
jgi:hypothetical protein